MFLYIFLSFLNHIIHKAALSFISFWDCNLSNLMQNLLYILHIYMIHYIYLSRPKSHGWMVCQFVFRWHKQFQPCALVEKFFHETPSWNSACDAMQEPKYLVCWQTVLGFNWASVPADWIFVPTKEVVCMYNKDKPWLDDQCRHVYNFKQEGQLRWTSDRSRVNWEEFGECQVGANEI